MSNDPNDRFMISDLSSKLSAYINGENYEQPSQTRDPADIEDVFASEIIPPETVRKLPGDELFTDLDQALDSRSDAREERARKQRIAKEQRQREEEARRQQLRNEQQRQQRIQEEQQRQQRIREEQQRQQRIREEQQRQQMLRREKALARSLAESLYSFDPDLPFTSVRSGHSVLLSKLSPAVRSMPSEAALKKALAKIAQADKTRDAGSYHDAPKGEPYYEAPKTDSYYEAPKADTYYEAPKADTYYEAPKADAYYEVPKSEPQKETLQPDTAQLSFDDPAHTSGPTGESRYAKSPDPSYHGYQEEPKGSKAAVIIALLIALLAIAAIFIIIRRYSSNLTNLLTGTPAAGTIETASQIDSKAEDEEESKSAENTDSSTAVESQAAVNMAIHEEGEIYSADSLPLAVEEQSEEIPEDPNDIAYLASVNEKAANDAIAELSEAAPRLYLSAYGIKINAGASFNALSYVENIEDDADDKDRLYRDISVDGLDKFDSKVPGTYELTYFCYDSAGNRSNRAKLTVIVE